MQKYVARSVALNFKKIVIGGHAKRLPPVKPNEEQFFKEYDQAFLMSAFIQDCLKNESLKIPVDFFRESRFDDFAEDHSGFADQGFRQE